MASLFMGTVHADTNVRRKVTTPQTHKGRSHEQDVATTKTI